MPIKGFFQSKAEVNTTYFYIILHIQISLVRNFSSNCQFWFFGPNSPKRYFQSKTGKVNIIEFRIFKLFLVPNFSLDWQFWFFWRDLPKKGFSGLKQKKWTSHIFYIILLIRIGLVRNFSSNWQFWFFGPNLHKNIFLVKNWKNEHHHWIPHIQISLGTKFQLKLKILCFYSRKVFQSKTERLQVVQRLQVCFLCSKS